MLSIAIQFQKADKENSLPDESELDSSLSQYREKVVQCLRFGRYTNGGPHVVQALMHYIVIEIFGMRDVDSGLWIVLGMVFNIARRMGYHRDPSQIPGLSPYEMEMRRRWWTSLLALDSSISESMGTERLEKDIGNVLEPQNLLDSDFDSTTTTLPPSRPETEPTPMLYCLAKIKALRTFNLVTDLVNAKRPYSYSEVMKVDSVLIKSHSEIPICYKWRPLTHSITESAQVISGRMCLEILYLKSQIVLHLKFVLPSRRKDDHAYSRKLVFESVSRLLEFHHICEAEIQPTGQLSVSGWRLQLAAHQGFLLASIAACFYLNHNRSSMSIGDLERLKKLCRASYRIVSNY
jgi:hypothetical protein